MATKRDTLQDAVKRGDFFFSSPTTFEKAFPTIEEVNVISTEKGYGVYAPRTLNYGKSYLGEYLNCSNGLCQRGGFWIGNEIRDMVSKGEIKREGLIVCSGDEGSPKGRRVGRTCINRIKVEISIKYKDVPQATGNEENPKIPAD